MANCKALFGVLNSGTGTGVGIDNANPGTTLGSAIDNTVATPSFVDSSGVLTFPQLDALGRIPVYVNHGLCAWGAGQVTGSTSFQDVATVTAALSKVYRDFSVTVNSMTECDWEVVAIDDVGGTPVETIIGYLDTGPGQYTATADFSCVEIDTSAGTGTQEIVVRGKLLEATGSLLGATISFHENV